MGDSAAQARKRAAYPAYKPSGVAWLGEIPAHWEAMPVKRVTRFYTGWTPPSGRDEYFQGDHLWANIFDLGPKVLLDTAKRISDEAAAESRLRISPKGSLLFSFKLSIGQVSIAGVDIYTNEAIASFPLIMVPMWPICTGPRPCTYPITQMRTSMEPSCSTKT